MKKLFVLFMLIMSTPAFSANDDIADRPELGAATTSDSILAVDASASAGSRLRRILFSGDANQFLAGNGGWSDSINLTVDGTTIQQTGTSPDIELSLKDTAVTPGSYTKADITVDQQGRITAAASGSAETGGYVTAPIYSDSACTVGQWSFDSSKIYICEASNQWDYYSVTFAGWNNPNQCGGFDTCQNLEDTGYDNSESFTEFGLGTVDEDYTTTALRGSQSLYIYSSVYNSNGVYRSITAASEVWGHFLIRFVALPGASEIKLFRLTDSSGANERAWLSITSTGQLKGAATGASTDYGSTWSSGTTYHIWWRYKARVGAADAEFDAYVGTTLNRSEATLDISTKTGTTSGNPERYYIQSADGTTDRDMQIIVDQIMVKTSSFTTVSE